MQVCIKYAKCFSINILLDNIKDGNLSISIQSFVHKEQIKVINNAVN